MSKKKPSHVSLSDAYNEIHSDGGSRFHVATDRGNGWLDGIRAAISEASPSGRVVVYDDNMRLTAERLRALAGAQGVKIVVDRSPYMRA